MSKQPKKLEEIDQQHLAVGIGVGIAVGAAIGMVVFDNIAIGIGVGLPIGVALAYGWTNTDKQKKGK